MEWAWRQAQNTRRMDSVRNGSICRRFINGSCSFGSRCHYRHELPALPSAQVCRYFQKGGCWYGPFCRYLHVLQPGVPTGRRSSVPTISSSSVVNSPPNRRGSVPAPLQAEGMSRQKISRLESVINYSSPQRNAGCLATDTAEAQTQDPGSNLVASVGSVLRSDLVQACVHDRQNKQEALMSETTDNGNDGDRGACAGAASAAAVGAPSTHLSVKDSDAYNRSKNVTCGICMETVYERADARSQMFGLLPNCNHSYCLPCIMTWRKTKDFGPDTVKSCPQCRVRSAFYVPYKYWVEGQEKERVISAFKDKCSKKSCSYYSRHGSCPFKTECLYRHNKESRRGSFQYPTDDEDDYDDVDLLNFFIAMTLISGDDFEDGDDDEDDDNDDYDLHYYIAGEYGC
ncbi:makorin, ring finger protein, 4 isoform X2 [Halichoeres trimaculatus]|uniref:makorin, ring finger protein, 4 isoform X2 n=1 Tax=Halichoeres trimaculatus TaxID=147232 RepID=UPI003D9EECAC